MTLPPVEVPLPHGGPAVTTPPISTPAISTPPVTTPAVGPIPSVSVPAVKIPPVAVSPVKTVPAASAGKPSTGGAADPAPKPEDPPTGGGSAVHAERTAAPAVAVSGATARPEHERSPTAARPDPAPRTYTAPHSAVRHVPTSTLPETRSRVDRRAAPASVERPAAPGPIPVADGIERHDADARPLVDALGRALDLGPILMALALGGALCAASSRLRRAG